MADWGNDDDFPALSQNTSYKTREFSNSNFKKTNIQQPRNDGPTDVMEVPSDKIKFVIGKGGSKIRELQETCEVNIQIGEFFFLFFYFFGYVFFYFLFEFLSCVMFFFLQNC